MFTEARLQEIEQSPREAGIFKAESALLVAAYKETRRPFVLLKPRMFPDGNQWCALYGEDLQSGVCAFGDTPDQAATQFDIEWLNAKAGPAAPATELLTSVLGDLPKFPTIKRAAGE